MKHCRVGYLVQGMGINIGKYPCTNGKKEVKEYIVWKSMLSRCGEKFWKRQPAYVGTTCSDNFKSYEYFYEWCQEQIGFKNVDENGNSWQLDKDIICRGNKLYSEDTCVFVPQRLNKLLIKSDSARGEHPIGVSFNKKLKKFVSTCYINEKYAKYLGLYETSEDAFHVYKAFKEAYVKNVAEKYKHTIDSRVYEALLSYEVHKND